MRQPEEFPNVVCWLPPSRAEVMNTMALDVQAAVFAATHYPSLLQQRRPGEAAYQPLTEAAYLSDLLAAGEPHALDVAVGDSGTGKSHFIRWLYNRITSAAPATGASASAGAGGKWCVKLIARSSANLSDVVSSLLSEFSGPAVDELKKELHQAGQKTTLQGAGHRLLNEYAFLLDPKNHEGPAPAAPKGLDPAVYKDVLDLLPAFLQDPQVRKWLLSEPRGVVTRLARHVTGRRGPRAAVGDAHGDGEKLLWVGDDLEVPPEVSAGVGADAGELAGILLTDDEARAAAVRILNDAFADVLNALLGLKRGDLRRAMRQVRRQLHQQGRELVLLIEDLSVAQGLDQDLLESLLVRTRDETHDRGGELCKLRSVVGVTHEDYNRMFDNIRLGRVTRTLFFNVRFSAGAHGREGEVGRKEVMDFASRYLNAARYGTGELAAWFNDGGPSQELPSFCTQSRCPNLAKCHAAFGQVDGRGLYPLSEAAAARLYEWAAARVAAAGNRGDDAGRAFNPRLMVSEVLNRVLAEAERTVPAKQFPPAALTQGLAGVGAGSHTKVELEERFRDAPDKVERLVAALELYSPHPAEGRLDGLVCEAFDLPPLGDHRPQKKKRLTLAFQGPLRDLCAALKAHGVELSVPAGAEGLPVECDWRDAPVAEAMGEVAAQLSDGRLIIQGAERYAVVTTKRVEKDPVEAWAGGGSVENRHLNGWRDLVYQAVSGSIDWDQPGLAALASQFERRYINFEGQVAKPLQGGSVVLQVARSPGAALALRGLREEFRAETEDESQRMVEQAARLVRQLSQGVLAQLRGLERAAGEPGPLEVAAHYLAAGAVVRGQLPPNASDADALSAALENWPQVNPPEGSSPAWQGLWNAFRNHAPPVRAFLKNALACSKGARGGACIDPAPVLAAVRLARSGKLPPPLPAGAEQWGEYYKDVRRLSDEAGRRFPEAIRAEREEAVAWRRAAVRLVGGQDYAELCRQLKKVVDAAAAEGLADDDGFTLACDKMAKQAARFVQTLAASGKVTGAKSAAAKGTGETAGDVDPEAAAAEATAPGGADRDADADLRVLAQLDRAFMKESLEFLSGAEKRLAGVVRKVSPTAAAASAGVAECGNLAVPAQDVEVVGRKIDDRLKQIARDVDELLEETQAAGTAADAPTADAP